MLGRVAFLVRSLMIWQSSGQRQRLISFDQRQVYVECKQAKTLKDYWKVVDKKLQEIRDMYAGKSNAKTMESQ